MEVGLFVRPFRRAVEEADVKDGEEKDEEMEDDDEVFLREARGLGLLGFDTR